MGILKTITDELRQVQAERELQDLLEVLRRRIDVITFGELAGLVTSALGKKLAAVKVCAILGAPTQGVGSSPPPPPTARATASSKKRAPAKEPSPKKSTRKAKAKAKAASAGKRKARASASTSKAASKPTKRSAKTKATKKTPHNKGATVTRAPVAPLAQQDQAVLLALGAHAAPLGIRSVLGAAGLTLSQANRTLRRLTAQGKVRMIGPKQRATYALAQGPGPDESGTSPASAEPATTATSTTGRTLPSRDAYDEAILAAIRDAGDWIGAAALREKVGGTSEQLRLALVHLVAAGILNRTGERNKTRYNLRG